MIRVFFLALMLLLNVTLYAQQEEVRPDDPAFIARYANLDFRGKFALAIDKDAASNYFMLDFSKLPTRFERVYYMNLSFGYEQLVNIDPDIRKSRVCFLANLKYDQNEILKIFDQIKAKVLIASESWSGDEKSQWLKSNDKYK